MSGAEKAKEVEFHTQSEESNVQSPTMIARHKHTHNTHKPGKPKEGLGWKGQ
jgi:hypothetical protein